MGRRAVCGKFYFWKQYESSVKKVWWFLPFIPCQRPVRAIEDALRKKDIPYRIYGGLSFTSAKGNKGCSCLPAIDLEP